MNFVNKEKIFCDRCDNDKEMKPTGKVWFQLPQKYEMKCLKCGYKKIVKDKLEASEQ
jgi:hypothetical protein